MTTITITHGLGRRIAAHNQEEGHMAVALDHHRRIPAKAKRKDAWEFRLIFLLSFCAFFVAALLERLTPQHWRAGKTNSRKSIFRQAKEAASTSIPYAFMG